MPAVAGGTTSLRRCVSSVLVAASCGPVVGISVITAAVLSLFTSGGDTYATPGAARSAESSAGRAAAASGWSSVEVTRNGPLLPRPKPSPRMS